MREIVIGFMAAITCKFMHDRHADLYLESKRLAILVSAKSHRNIYTRNFNRSALGTKAKSGWSVWCTRCATYSLVI
jgi:hypothetical protein